MATMQPGPERTIGQLVVDASRDVQGIIRSEIALAKAEVSVGAKVMGKGVAMLAVGGVFGLLGLIFLLHTAARALALVLPVWAGYAIVAGVLLLIALILALIGIKKLKRAKPAPTRAIAEAQQTVATLKQSV